MINETRVRVAARLYEMRATARRLFGDEYRERIRPYMDAVQQAAAKWRCSELAACKRILEEAQRDRPFDSEFTTMLLCAGCVELLEPSGNLTEVEKQTCWR